MTVAWHASRLDKQNVAAHRRPRESGCYTWHAGAHRDFTFKPRCPENALHVRSVDRLLSDTALSDPDCHVAKYRTDLTFQVAASRFARVVTHDLTQRRFSDRCLSRLQAVGLQLTLDQIALGDLDLLVLRVAREFNDLHTIPQRPGNRIEH